MIGPGAFRAQELQSDGTFAWAAYSFEETAGGGFLVRRAGRSWLALPEGYQVLEVLACGVCSTDHARVHLPFALPQIIGHEIVARDETGRLVALEINASHAAVGSPQAAACPMCAAGLGNHCPERLVLGIDRLPGGFGPFVLVPRKNVVPVPDGMDVETAALIEPFAAALHAVETIVDGMRLPEGGAPPDSVAVLGAGRLGLLAVAALGAYREENSLSFDIAAVEPNAARRRLARTLGADEVFESAESARRGGRPLADAVIESTGSPEGLAASLALARREVHLKSTTGLPALGLRHLTEMVVDEVALAPLSPGEAARWYRGKSAPQAVVLGEAAAGAEHILSSAGFSVRRLRAKELAAQGPAGLAATAGVVAVAQLDAIDLALRPWPGVEQGLVRPRGAVLAAGGGRPAGALLDALVARGVRITTSRCGDLRQAFPLLERFAAGGVDLGALLVTHRLPADDLHSAMAASRRPDAIKVLVEH